MSDESHAGMTGDDLADRLRSVGVRTLEDLIVRMEQLDRSDVWVFVAFDADDPERPINAIGFWPDEHGAFLAGQVYEREWDERAREDDEPGVVTKAVPLFIERRFDAD